MGSYSVITMPFFWGKRRNNHACHSDIELHYIRAFIMMMCKFSGVKSLLHLYDQKKKKDAIITFSLRLLWSVNVIFAQMRKM